jgi:hypothetical protein
MKLRPLTLLVLLGLSGGCIIQAPADSDDSADDTSSDASDDGADSSGTGQPDGSSGTSHASACDDPEVELLVHEIVAGDETWGAGRHLVQDYLAIEGEVIVEPCAVVMMAPGAMVMVQNGGSLRMEGTAEAPILVTSANEDPAPGDWNAIAFYGTSSDDNVLRHVTVEHGGGGGQGQLWIDNGAALSMSDSTSRDSDRFGLELSAGGEVRDFTGNTLVDNHLGPVRLSANAVDALGPGTYGPNEVEGIVIGYESLDHDAQWEDLGVPYRVEEGMRVETLAGSANLTITAGTTLALGPTATLAIGDHGGLHLAGEAGARVTVRSAKEPAAAGDWAYIELAAGSNAPANRFEHVDISGGGGSVFGQVYVATGAELTLDDVTFSASGQACDITTDGALQETDSTWVDCG